MLPEDKRNVTMVDIVKPEATFTVELPERAVRALALIGGFGESALEKCVASVLSPMEAKRHSYGNYIHESLRYSF